MTMRPNTVRLIAFAIIVVIALPSPLRAQTETPQGIAKLAVNASVEIVACPGTEKARYGSGFYVGHELVATCAHLVDGCISLLLTTLDDGNVHRDVSTIAIDRVADVALLWVRCNHLPHFPLSLSHSSTVEVGDTIYVVGNPIGYDATFSPGMISAIRTNGNHLILQITAPVSPGSSGGAILNQKGTVVGIVTSTRTGAQNLNFGAAIDSLCALAARKDMGSVFFCVKVTPQDFFRHRSTKKRLRKRPKKGLPGDQVAEANERAKKKKP